MATGGVLLAILIGNVTVLKTYLSLTSPVKKYEQTVRVLREKYPGKKFVVYDYQYRFPYYSQPLSLLLSNHNMIDSKGVPIGITCYAQCPITNPVITSIGGLAIVDLSHEKNIDKKKWTQRNPDYMYDDLIGWSKNHELTSTFSLQKYIREMLHIRSM